jgi:hypothetical protein
MSSKTATGSRSPKRIRSRARAASAGLGAESCPRGAVFASLCAWMSRLNSAVGSGASAYARVTPHMWRSLNASRRPAPRSPAPLPTFTTASRMVQDDSPSIVRRVGNARIIESPEVRGCTVSQRPRLTNACLLAQRISVPPPRRVRRVIESPPSSPVRPRAAAAAAGAVPSSSSPGFPRSLAKVPAPAPPPAKKWTGFGGLAPPTNVDVELPSSVPPVAPMASSVMQRGAAAAASGSPDSKRKAGAPQVAPAAKRARPESGEASSPSESKQSNNKPSPRKLPSFVVKQHRSRGVVRSSAGASVPVGIVVAPSPSRAVVVAAPDTSARLQPASPPRPSLSSAAFVSPVIKSPELVIPGTPPREVPPSPSTTWRKAEANFAPDGGADAVALHRPPQVHLMDLMRQRKLLARGPPVS